MKEVKSIDIGRIEGKDITLEKDILVIEYPFTIIINGKEIITLLCTPKSLDHLLIGFLYSEGFINSYSDIKGLRIEEGEAEGRAYVKMDDFNRRSIEKRTVTSGLGKGTVFYNVMDSFTYEKIEEPIEINLENIKGLIGKFSRRSQLFIKTGGAHSCALCDSEKIIIFEEDIGRHNALDKIFGRALVENIDLEDKMILASGRISSEMLIKAAKRKISLVISRSAPTSLSVDIARKLGIGLIGFARGERMNVYSNFSMLDSR